MSENNKNGNKAIYGVSIGGVSAVGIIGYTVLQMLTPSLERIEDKIIENNKNMIELQTQDYIELKNLENDILIMKEKQNDIRRDIRERCK